MQNLESSSIQASTLQAHRNIQQHGQPELIFPRHEHPTSEGNKFPGLIIEDETKHYMDGVDEDTSDGEPDSKMSRGSADRQKKTRGRVKIRMEFIQNKLRRYTTFSKRKTGIMKKAYELSTLTGTQVMLLVASETGHVYTFATRKLQPMITSESGKALIQTCLNSPDPTPLLTQLAPQNPSDQRMSQTGYEEPDLQYGAGDEDIKPQASEGPPTMMTGIQFTQGGQGITTYIAPPSSQVALHQPAPQASHPTPKTSSSQQVTYSLQTVPAGAVTAILASGNNPSSASSGQTVHLHQAAVQPQIIQGQLQMHKIHPQNILLSGNMPGMQGGHIIISPNQVGSQVVIADGAHFQSSSSVPVSSSHSHENIIILPSGGSAELPPGAVQMVYNGPNGLVYASPASVMHSHSQANTTSESVTIHHQPSVQSVATSYHIPESSQASSSTAVLQAS